MPMFIDGKEVKKVIVNGVESPSVYYRKGEDAYSLVFENDPTWVEYDKTDPFNDNSCVAMFAFEDGFSDANNIYTFTNSGATIDTTDSRFPKCLNITAGASLALSNFNIPGAFTIMFFIKAASFPSVHSWIFQFGTSHGITSSSTVSRNLSLHYPSVVIYDDTTTTSYIADGEWAFVSLVVKGLSASVHNVRWYKNGVHRSSIMGGPIGALPPISMLNIASSRNFNGKIKDLRIFNRAVTDAEIAAIMTAEGIV